MPCWRRQRPEQPREWGNLSQTLSPSAGGGADNSPSADAPTLTNGLLTTPDLKIQITRYKVIGAGQKGSLPDERFLDSQTENIKKGGTVEDAVAYELDDLVTPVDLVATEGLDEGIGKATYKLR